MKVNLWLLTATAFAAALTGCQRGTSDAGPQSARAASAAKPFDKFDETLEAAQAWAERGSVGLFDDILAPPYLEALQAKAEQGSPKAQAALGSLYYKGKGVPQDLAKAAEWWRRAAEQGDRQSQSNMGDAYYVGEGVVEDRAQAVQWWRRAAESGHTYAQSQLGTAYFTGAGLDKDAAKAVEWWQKAAAQGDSNAQQHLGQAYATGNGVPKNDIKASEWFAKAAANGDAQAQSKIGVLYLLGTGVPQDRVLAYAWLNLAAAQGWDGAKKVREMFELRGDQLAEAQRLSSNWKKGQTLVREAASAGNSAQGGAIAKRGTGTAFWVSKAGHAITNHHVVDGCREIRQSGRDGALKVVTTDAANDIALLQLAESVPQVAAVSSASPPVRQGDNVVVFGFPLNAVLSSGGNITPGVVSALTGLGNDTNQIQITAPIQPGSSGSPVLNMKGEVVGVVMGKLSDN